MHGADILVQCLIDAGVNTVFGYPGTGVLSLYDALRRNKKRVKHYMCTHEQYCAHAADGYARSTGKTGVVIATSGPGSTNLVTGIANAYMDSVPMVIITGNVSLDMLGRDSFQEIDIAGVTMPVTKHNYIVKSVDALEKTVKDAFRIASSGRKGPVLVDVPRNIFDEKCEYTGYEAVKPKAADFDVSCAAEAINESKRPFVCAGGGVISSEAAGELFDFVNKISAHVALTAMGKGAFPSNDIHFMGLVGLNPNEATLEALSSCDLFIGIGIRFSERLMLNVKKYLPYAKILHIDIDRAEIGKNIDACSYIVGDAREVLKSLIPRVNAKTVELTQKNNAKKHYIFSALNEMYGSAVYTTEVGVHQMEACNQLETIKPRMFLTSGGLGTMGFGLAAAIGAQIAYPDKRVINIAGDGSYNMNLHETATAVKYSLPIIQVIINDGKLAMIEQMQDARYGRRRFESKTNVKTDYVALAKAFGAKGFDGSTEKSFRKALAYAKTSRLPVVIDCRVTTI